MLKPLLRFEWLFWLTAAVLTVFLPPVNVPLFLAFPILMGLRWWGGLPVLPKLKITIPIIGLLFMIGVSAEVTPDLGYSMRKIAGLIHGIALLVALLTSARPKPLLDDGLLLVCGWFVFTAGILAADIYARIPLLFPLFRGFYFIVPFLPDVNRVLNGNLIAGALLWTLLPTVGLFVYAKQNMHFGRQWGAAIAIPLQAVLLLLMQSRAALIGVVVGTFFLLSALVPTLRRPFKVGGWLALLAVLLALLPIWPDRWEEQAQAIYAIYSETLEKGDEGERGLDSILSRLDIWERALHKIQERPLTGHGMNIFRTIANEPTPVFEPEKMIPHAHNWAMQIVLELGIPGLLCYLWLVVAAFQTLWQQWHVAPGHRPKAAGYAAALIAFMIYGLLDTISPGARPEFIFWVLLAAVFRLPDYETDQQM